MNLSINSSNTNINSLQNKFESLLIKKTGENRYVLYGLMWWEYIENGVPAKSLVSIKSNNLKWDYQINITEDIDLETCCGGLNNSPILDFITGITKTVLYQFQLTNVKSNGVLVEFTILNKGRDGFMEYNIYEGLENYIVEVNVAGVKKEEIKIVLEDETIKVKTYPEPKELEGYDRRLEMFRPVRSEIEIFVPNSEEAKAELKDGVLILTVPKVSKGIEIPIA